LGNSIILLLITIGVTILTLLVLRPFIVNVRTINYDVSGCSFLLKVSYR